MRAPEMLDHKADLMVRLDNPVLRRAWRSQVAEDVVRPRSAVQEAIPETMARSDPEMAETVREAQDRGIDTLLQPVMWTDGGPFAVHNMPCAVCRQRHAIIDLSEGAFGPCWECRRLGWRLTPPPRTLLQRLANKLWGDRW